LIPKPGEGRGTSDTATRGGSAHTRPAGLAAAFSNVSSSVEWLHCSCRCDSRSRSLCGRRVPKKKVFLTHIRWHRNVKETNHHLIVRLAAPSDGLVRIGVVHIFIRIVVPGHCLQPSSSL